MCGASRSPCMLTLRCVLLCTWAPPRPATLTAVAKPRSCLRSWAMAADWLEVAAAESASSELGDWGGIAATCSIDHTSDEEWASIVAALPAHASPEIDEPSAVVFDDAFHSRPYAPPSWKAATQPARHGNLERGGRPR